MDGKKGTGLICDEAEQVWLAPFWPAFTTFHTHPTIDCTALVGGRGWPDNVMDRAAWGERKSLQGRFFRRVVGKGGRAFAALSAG
jgi:hypothetical protein